MIRTLSEAEDIYRGEEIDFNSQVKQIQQDHFEEF